MSATFFTLEELGLRSDGASQNANVRADCRHFASDPSVLEINDLATLGELQPLWSELLAKTPRPAFCQTFEWLQLYLRHFGDRQRLRVFCIDEQGETAGLTVLIEQHLRGQRELTLPNAAGGTLWPLGANPARQWFAVGQHLRAELTRKHTLDLRGLADLRGETLSALQAAGLNVQLQPWVSTTTLNLCEDFTAFWSRVSSSVRSLVEVGEQKLAALGSTNFVRFRPQWTDRVDPRFPDELYHDCLNVALSDEKQLVRADSVLNAPERHLFLRDLLPWAWRHAAADLCLLLAGSRPIAFRFHTLMSGRLRTIWTGVDAEFRQLPLATLLLHRTLRDSCQRGDGELDLGSTHPDVARKWGGASLPLCRLVVGASTTASSAQQHESMSDYGD